MSFKTPIMFYWNLFPEVLLTYNRMLVKSISLRRYLVGCTKLLKKVSEMQQLFSFVHLDVSSLMSPANSNNQNEEEVGISEKKSSL